MDTKDLKEIGKALLYVITGVFMVPILIFLEWAWPRWTALWGRSKKDSALFVLYAPFVLFFHAIAWVAANPWENMIKS